MTNEPMTNKPMKKKLFLLDAMALIYRAYYALNKNPRVNSKGLNTSAILGFANAMYDIIRTEKPTHLAVSFDTGEPTQRHIDFTAYKAHREAMPEDIAISLPYILRLIEAFNITAITKPGYEADDIIGTLARIAEKKDFMTYIMTTDKDLGQMVTDRIHIYKPGRMGSKYEILGVKEVCDRYGIKRPEQVIDILGLWGDASDNIPGVPGIGEVTACKLIIEYDSVENVLNNADKLKGKLRENLEQFREQAIMSKNLATIITDVPVEFDEEQLRLKRPDEDKLKELLDELEFRTFAKRVFTDLSLSQQNPSLPGEENAHPVSPSPFGKSLDVESDLFNSQSGKGSDLSGNLFTENPDKSSEPANINTITRNYILVDSAEKRHDLLEKLKQQKSFCFDTETTGLDSNNSELVGIAFSFIPGEAYFIRFPDNYNDTHKIVIEFKSVFENTDIEKVGQNIKFDISLLKWYDIEVKGPLFDTMLAHYLIQPDMRHNMDYLAETYLNYHTVHIEELIGKKGKDQLTMRTVPVDIIKDYTCEDADITLKLKHVFEPMLTETKTRKLFDEIEVPLVPVLASMEAEGVTIDTKALNEYSLQLKTEIEVLEKDIINDAGEQFNVSSPKQLGDILFNKLKIIDNPKKTATKQNSTSEETLTKLLSKHPIVQKILDYRSLTKLKSTYVDILPLMLNPRTGRIHTSYNQAVAATGRLSSNNPNLQNIPIRSDRGKEIRKAFIPRNDKFVLLSADYSQIELRLMAEMSKDPAMLEAFRNGLDIHAATASRVFGIPVDQVTSDQRRKAKTVNFGIIYGISAFGLSERINIPRKEAAEIIEQYFKNFAAIKDYMNRTIEFARMNGYVETVFGRRRYIRDINSGNGVIRGFAERNAINAPLQGTAADIIKIAMIDIFRKLNDMNLKTKMIMQVHDELVFDVYKEEIETVVPIISDLMCNSPFRLLNSSFSILNSQFSIPLEVDISSGKNWLDAH